MVGCLGITLFAALPVCTYAQKVDLVEANVAKFPVKGVVIDASTGKALAGVRVSVVNEKVSAMSDENGQFKFDAPNPNVTLRVEAPGYQPQVMALRGQSDLSLSLSGATGMSFYDKEQLDAVSQDVVSEFLLGRSTADDAVADLQGSLFAVSRSGIPGSGSTVFVHGLHSINASSQPLYVVDGVVWTSNYADNSIIEGHYSNPLALIDPNDIENISVLKNGTAIYGAKGGNGVIVITTKRAKNAATEIEAYANLGVRTAPKSIPVMNAEQYRLYVSDILSGKFENSSYVEKYNFLNDDQSKSQYKAYHNDTDWLDLVSRDAMLMNYGVNVKGGDDRALYAFSLGYTKNEGTLEETSFDRLNVRFNSDINLWAGFTLRFDVAFAQATQKLRDDGMNAVSSPYFMSLVKSPLYHPNVISNKGDVTLKYSDVDELGIGNPLSIYDLGNGESKNYRFNLNVAPEYRFSEKLAVRGLLGYTFDKVKENSFLPDYGVAETELVNNNGEVYAVSRNVVKSLMNRSTTFIADLHGDYQPLKSYNHELGVKLGFRWQNDTYSSSYGEGHNTSSDYMNDLSNTSSSLHFSDGVISNWRSMAWYASAEYAFMQRYLLGVDMSLESSSRFGNNASGVWKIGGAAWGTFPSVNAGWIVSSEEWMKDVRFINFLKLRAGYDIAGNDNLPDYATATYFASVGLMDNAFGLALSNIGNDKLKWETTSTARLGLDISLLNNRWSLSFDYYTAKTKDLLVRKQLKDVAGLATFWTNGGELKNSGFNVSTSVRALNHRNWKLDIGASIGHYNNEITKLDDGNFITNVCGGQVLTSVGNPVGVFYGYKTDGVFSTTEAAKDAGLNIRNANGSLTPFEAGDMKFVDNGDGVIDENDCVIIGDPTPDFYGNFNLNITWKNLTIGTLFTYSVGNDVYNALRANLESGSDVYNQSKAMSNRWVANGRVADIPRATYGDPMGNARFSDRWIEDGSYLKWKSLAVSYNFPFKSQYIQGLTLSFSVSNLCTFTKYLGADPEFSMGNSPLYLGVDAGLLPVSREFNFGVKINL